MKRNKLMPVRILSVVMLLAGLAFTSCKDNTTSPFVDNEMQSYAFEGNEVMSVSQAADNSVLDDFISGGGTFVGSGHSSKFEYHESATILGGAREIYLRDAASGTLGGATYATIDTDMGTLRLYTTGRAAAENAVMYGTAIGTIFRSWAPSPNQGKGTQLNLELTLEDFIQIDVAATGISSGITVILRSGNGAVNQANFALEVGENLIPLSGFPNLTEAAAADIDGIAFGGINTFESFSFKKAEPEVVTNVYISDNSVDTYDPLFPATADPNWTSTVCYQGNSFGINANWSNPHKAFQVTKDPSPNGAPHPWESNTFEAFWINAVNDMDSPDTKDMFGNAGPGGHNWTRYDTQVSGNGEFVVQLLADNCSWVYLADENGNAPQLIGYQGAVSTPGEYGVSLDGDHTLIFIIFDGGGLAGGKFRLETTESFGGVAPPPIVSNAAPSADAGSDQTVTATGQTTPVTLNGSGSSDPDGDALSYSWTIDGAEVANTETAVINLADGTYTVTLTVSDGALSDSDDVTVTVLNTIPVADAGADQTHEATGPLTTVTLDGSGSSDADGDALTYVWSSGGTDVSTTVNLGVGTHTFTLTVTDEQGASDSDEVVITITDTTAPVLSFNQITGALWPPNHKMVLVATGIAASDIVDGATNVTVSVSSNESTNGKGDGNTDSDWEVVTNDDGTKDVYVRSERSGKGNGRTYSITVSTSDVAGNSASDRFEVKVAHNQGRGRGR